MPLAKLPSKRAASKKNKCPSCGSRKFATADKLSLLEKFRFIGCKVWVCGKCNKKWGG